MATEPDARDDGTPSDTPPARRRAGVVVAAFAVVVLAAAAVVVVRSRGPQPVAAFAPLTSVIEPATDLAQPELSVPPATGRVGTTSTTDPLPYPEAPPNDLYAPTPEQVVSRMSIPRIGLEADVQQGITLTAIDRGPSHWPGTPLPGELGNVVVAGHRNTHSRPFADLDQLQPGDRVSFQTNGATQLYEVRGTIIVPAANIGIAAQARAHTATLFACHPKGSAAERIVVKLRMLHPDGTPVDPDAALPPVDVGADLTTGSTLHIAPNVVAVSSGGVGGDG